jgi:hypothetical protein
MFSCGKEVLLSDFLGNLLRTIIIKMNEAELIKKTAHGAIAATRKPPTVGPTARAMLLAMALNVSAAGISDFGTNALKAGIIGVLIIVAPAPSAKVNNSNIEGVVISATVRKPKIVETANMYPHVIRSILRRSKISEVAPEGIANRKIGRVLAVIIRETNKGFGASEVISHDAPTSYIAAPTYENSAAIHNVLYKLSLKGLKPETKLSFFLSTIRSNNSDLVINFRYEYNKIRAN